MDMNKMFKLKKPCLPGLKAGNYDRLKHVRETEEYEGEVPGSPLPTYREYYMKKEHDYAPIYDDSEFDDDGLPDKITWERSQSNVRSMQLKATEKLTEGLQKVHKTTKMLNQFQDSKSSMAADDLDEAVNEQGHVIREMNDIFYEQLCLVAEQKYLDIRHAVNGEFTREQWAMWAEQEERLKTYENEAKEQLEQLGFLCHELQKSVKVIKNDVPDEVLPLVVQSCKQIFNQWKWTILVKSVWTNPRPPVTNPHYVHPKRIPPKVTMIPPRPECPKEKKRKRSSSGSDSGDTPEKAATKKRGRSGDSPDAKRSRPSGV